MKTWVKVVLGVVGLFLLSLVLVILLNFPVTAESGGGERNTVTDTQGGSSPVPGMQTEGGGYGTP